MATRRYAAFLRGVMPTNAKMPELKRAFEAAGFTDVKTVLTSGNVVFTAREAPEAALQRKAEAAMTAALGRSFLTIIRSIDELRRILDGDPYAEFRVAPEAKRVVTFLREPGVVRKLPLPVEFDGARILCQRRGELFTAYVPSPRGPAFMTLIQKTLGEALTTRTWDTVTKVARDQGGKTAGGKTAGGKTATAGGKTAGAKTATAGGKTATAGGKTAGGKTATAGGKTLERRRRPDR